MDLEKFFREIAKDVRKEIQASKGLRPPNHPWGECGYAAKRVLEQLLAKGVPRDAIAVYTFSGGYHTVVAVGSSFQNSWKIEPVADFQHDDRVKLVYAPGERYWLTDPSRKLVTSDDYFIVEPHRRHQAR